MAYPETHEPPAGGNAEGAGKTAGLAEVLRRARRARNESQSRFWARFGVTQSRGSRFELGKEIPSPVAILLKLYFDGVISDGDLWRARRGQLARTPRREA